MSGTLLQLRVHVCVVCVVIAFALSATFTCGSARAQSQQPPPETRAPVEVFADYSHEWTNGETQIFLLRGRCRITQGESVFEADKAVLWQRTEQTGRSTKDRVSVYLEGSVRVEQPGQTLREHTLFLPLQSADGVSVNAGRRSRESAGEDPLFLRGQKRYRRARRDALQQTQLVVQNDPQFGPELTPIPLQPQDGQLRRIKVFPRDGVSFNIDSFPSDQTTPPEQVTILTGGVRMIIEGVEFDGLSQLGDTSVVDLAADRIVFWTDARSADGITTGGQPAVQSRDTPLTVYLEGNIVVRQGDNEVRASRATYDAREHRALYDNVELRTFVPQLEGDIRIRAERVRQSSRRSFHAQNGWVTGSKFGQPGYRLSSTDIFLEDRYTTPAIGPGADGFDPITGVPLVEPTTWITALNNTFLIEELPVFYTPYLSAPAKDPQIPLRRASVGYDRIFGGKLNTAWNLYQLLGLEEPDNARWDLLLDGYTERGPAIGTEFDYSGTDLLGLAGRYGGDGLFYYIHDDGNDDLGADRRSVTHEINKPRPCRMETSARVAVRNHTPRRIGLSVGSEFPESIL